MEIENEDYKAYLVQGRSKEVCLLTISQKNNCYHNKEKGFHITIKFGDDLKGDICLGNEDAEKLANHILEVLKKKEEFKLFSGLYFKV